MATTPENNCLLKFPYAVGCVYVALYIATNPIAARSVTQIKTTKSNLSDILLDGSIINLHLLHCNYFLPDFLNML